MNRNSKKGFTIVELIIVIAVIAVLAAVLIPTFSNLIQKANVAADQTLIKNLNTALAMDTTVSKHETMTQALEATKANGFDVEKIVARATKNRIVWDSANDCFAYIEEGKTEPTYIPDTKTDANVADYQLWTIVDSKTLDAKYSSYIAGTSVSGAVEATKGVDVGENTGITAVSYTNTGDKQDVVIRTNGGKLTVNAPADTVKHYGDAQVVTLTAVGNHSYYEHGSVNLVDVKTGRLVITNDAEAEVGTIYLTATNDAYDGIILATQNGATLPEVVARESVSNPTTDKKLVVTIQTNVDAKGENPTKTEEIYLYPASDVKEGTNGYNVSDLGLLVVEAISAEAQTEAAEQITDATVLENVKESNVATKDEIVAAATMFAGGKGTENAPYIISNAREWNNMYVVMKKAHDEIGTDYPTIYFRLRNDIDLGGYGIDCLDGWKYYNHMSFDGQGYTVKNIDTILRGDSTFVLWPYLEKSTIQNVTIDYAISDDGSWGFGMCYVPRNNTHFINVKTTGYIESTTAEWISTFGMYAGFNSITYYENCTNEANLTGFFGNDCYITPFGSHCGGTGAKVSFEKCANYGSISGGDAAGFVGMGNNDHFIFVGDDAAVNYGEINGAKAAGHFQYGTKTNTFTVTGSGSSVTNTVCGNGSKINTISTFTTTAPSQMGENLSFESLDSAVNYKVRISIATQRYNYDDGSNKDVWSGGFPVTVYNQVVDSEIIDTAFVKAYVYESNNSKKDCRTHENCSYNGLYAPEGFSVENAEILFEDNGFYLVKYNDKCFYYLNLGEYDGLLTTTMQNDNSKTLSVSFDIVAYNQKGSVLGTSSCSYNFTIAEANAAR